MIKSIAYMAVAAIFCQGLTSLRAFLLARLVAPEEYGLWTAVQLIITLAPIAVLGTLEALIKEVSFFRGKGDKASQTAVESSILGSAVLAAVAIIIIYFGLGELGWFRFFKENPTLVHMTALTASASCVSSFYYFRTMACEDFRLVGLMDTAHALISTAGILLPAKFYGVNGAAVGLFVSEIITGILFAFLCTRHHGVVKVSFSRKLIFNAIRIGLPITLIWWIYTVQSGISRMASITWLGKELTGYFGAAASLANMVVLVPNMVARVFYPRVNAQLGAEQSIEEIKKSVIDPVTVLAVIIPFFQLIAVFALPIIYASFLKKYSPGLLCGQILVLGAFFSCVIRNGVNFLIAANGHRLLIIYVIGTCLLNLLLVTAAVKLGFGLNGIAVAVSCAAATLAFVVWQRVFRQLKFAPGEQIGIMEKLLVPFVSAAAIWILCNFLVPGSAASIPMLTLQLALSLSAYLGVCLYLQSTRVELRVITRRGHAAINAALNRF
jgi:O-antigen/teichoic acid export membrane protein